MKSGRKLVQGIMLVLFLGVVAYFAVYAYNTFLGGYDTAAVYSYSTQRTVYAEGYLVREETVLEDGSELEEIVVGEGENVAVGDVVAHSYDSQEALEQHQELQKLEEELARLDQLRSQGSEESDALRLNNGIVDAITTLKADTTQGDFASLEDQITDLKDLIFRRDYTYSSGAALGQQIQEVNSRIVELQAATAADVSSITSPAAGIYSATVDGYEGVFEIDTLDDLTPAQIKELGDSREEPSGEELGKVVTSFTWYYVAVMDQEVSKRLTTGDTATVNFEGSAGAQKMTVQHLSEPDENGQVAVVFRSNKNLSSVTLLREQNVEVGYDNCDGLRIPAGALRADQETGQLGVYRIIGAQAQWVPVKLIYSGSDYYLVQSDTTQTDVTNSLRAGDTVMVRGKEIYDGKVVA